MAEKSAQATQSAPSDVASLPGLEESNLTLDEMTRVMDVARTLRKETSIAERELNRDDTIAMLRKKLREAADLAGDTTTDEQIEAAIRHYFDNLHEFQPPESGWDTTMANIYVARKQIVGWTMAAIAVALMTWGFWFSGMMPGQRRTELRAQQTYSQVEEVTRSIESLATDGAIAEQAQQAQAEAATYRDLGDVSALEQLRDRLLQQASVMQDEYQLMIVTQGQSGVDRYVGQDTAVSGYYLIVEAVDSNGKPLPMKVRNAETGKYETVSKWGEQVSKEVYDSVAADKQADGVVDAREFAVKRRGETDLEVTLGGPGGASIERGRQITSW